MPPRKVKVVSMGVEPTTEPLTSTMVILNDEEIDVAVSEPIQKDEEEEEKPLLDNDEIDAMLEEVRNNKDALIMAGVKTLKAQDKRTECLHCGKLLSKKSLKYSHAKTCKGLQPEDIQQVEEAPEPEPEPEPEPIKPKRSRAKKERAVATPIQTIRAEEPDLPKTKTAAEMLIDHRDQRRQLRQVRISMLASQAF